MIIGYHVYYAPDGCAETYLGRVATLDEARALVGSGGLPACLYETARAAGHVAGREAPDTRLEAEEPALWFGDDGFYCAVALEEGSTS